MTNYDGIIRYQRWGREKEVRYKVELNSIGNPDRGQDPTKQIDGAWAVMKHVDSIEEAQKAVRAYIERHNLGAGNWAGGKVWTEENVYVGHISYNGRFWEDNSNNIVAF